MLRKYIDANESDKYTVLYYDTFDINITDFTMYIYDEACHVVRMSILVEDYIKCHVFIKSIQTGDNLIIFPVSNGYDKIYIKDIIPVMLAMTTKGHIIRNIDMRKIQGDIDIMTQN